MGLVAERAPWEPACEVEGNREADGDEGVGEVAFRPRPRSTGRGAGTAPPRRSSSPRRPTRREAGRGSPPASSTARVDAGADLTVSFGERGRGTRREGLRRLGRSREAGRGSRGLRRVILPPVGGHPNQRDNARGVSHDGQPGHQEAEQEHHETNGQEHGGRVSPGAAARRWSPYLR